MLTYGLIIVNIRQYDSYCSKWNYGLLYELLSIARNYLETPSLDYELLGNFILSKSIILVKDLIRQKEGFEIYLIDHYAVVIGNKNIAGRYIYIFCISVIHPRLGESVHTGWYIYNSLIYIIHYLSAFNKGLLIET